MDAKTNVSAQCITLTLQCQFVLINCKLVYTFAGAVSRRFSRPVSLYPANIGCRNFFRFFSI